MNPTKPFTTRHALTNYFIKLLDAGRVMPNVSKVTWPGGVWER